uniref:Ubiquitin-like protease family profile domain-containing protein n=1 Tax=Brassica oleracea TaxID=3712 RepID=A0A3P6FDY3_BRAOL|nr:unnamed protein product [Brassica oleracea]
MWISIPKRHIVVQGQHLFQRSPRKTLDVRPTNIPSARAGDCGVYTLKRLTFKSSGKSSEQ